MPRIEATKALYIKLGEGGKYERGCIEEHQTLRLGYQEAPHALCLERRWDEIAELALIWTKGKGAAKCHANQVRLFYESGSDTLWITFYKGLLWWCFSKPAVSVLEDKSKTRPVIGRWRSDNVAGNELQMSGLSGKLLMLQGFRGTICDVREREYVLRKINGEQEPSVKAAKRKRDSLVDKIQTIICNLGWRDFELLVDLIFTNAGWKRVSEVGGAQKTVDLVLDAPIIGRRYGVQVKSEADRAAFEEYKGKVENRPEPKHYFVVHSPSPDIRELAERMTGEEKEKVEVLGPHQLADLSVKYGLVDWIIGKAG